MKLNHAAMIFGLTASSVAFANFKVQPYATTQLDNGLTVNLIKQNEVPLVHITVGVKAGSAADGKQWGLGSLTAESLSLGTKSYSKQQIEDTLDFYGIDYGSGIDKDYSTFDFSVATADLPKLMPIVAEMIEVPKFPATEVDKLKARTVAQLKKGKESPNKIGGELFERVYYKEHPYASPDSGVPETVQKLKAADLQKFHDSHFQPQITAITVAGDFNNADVKAQIQKYFGGWKKGAAAPLVVSQAAPAAASTNVLLIDKDDAHETTFRIGGVGIPRKDKDWAALQVVNTVLGGRFTSILNEELRVKSGYTYGAKSRFHEWANSGTFEIQTFTATETTFQTLDLGLETYKKFVAAGLDQKTLDSAKAYVKGQYPPTYETLGSQANLATELWAYGITLDEFNAFLDQVDSLTLDQANNLIKTRLPSADQLQILLIGKAKTIGEQAKKYGTFRQIPISKIDGSTEL